MCFCRWLFLDSATFPREVGEQEEEVAGSEAREPLLRTQVPPRASQGTLRVKLSRKERLLTLSAELSPLPAECDLGELCSSLLCCSLERSLQTAT